MTRDECRPVEVVVDGQPETIRVHGGAEPSAEAAAALGVLVAAVHEKAAREHPHLGLVQELMLAWGSVRRELSANDSRSGRKAGIAAKKARMVAAIQAVRAALDEAEVTS